MPKRTKEETERTRNTILDSAEHVFYKLGFVRASLQEVAEHAGFTRGAVYWHFKNKMDLLDAVIKRVILPHEEIFQKIVSEDSDSVLEEYSSACRYVVREIIKNDRKRKIFTIMNLRCEYTEEEKEIMDKRREAKKRMFERTVSLFEIAKRKGRLNDSWDPVTAAVALHGMIIGLIVNGLENDGGDAFCDMAEKAIDRIFDFITT